MTRAPVPVAMTPGKECPEGESPLVPRRERPQPGLAVPSPPGRKVRRIPAPLTELSTCHQLSGWTASTPWIRLYSPVISCQLRFSSHFRPGILWSVPVRLKATRDLTDRKAGHALRLDQSSRVFAVRLVRHGRLRSALDPVQDFQDMCPEQSFPRLLCFRLR